MKPASEHPGRNRKARSGEDEPAEFVKVSWGHRVKPQQLVFAHVLPRNVRRRDVASSIKQQHDGSSSRAGQRRPTQVLEPGWQERAMPSEILELPVPSEARLKAVFDLSTAEARLAQHLARGDSVEEAAQALNIKMTTARTQLAAIFVKTDTRRQAKLVAILSRLAHLDR